jgi:arginine exporter protein ArgO
MKVLIGGVVAAALGIIGISLWFGAFVTLLKGAVPVMLIMGGALAIYIGFDELKDSWKNDADDSNAEDSPEKYQQEIDDLKKEVETLKTNNEKEK